MTGTHLHLEHISDSDIDGVMEDVRSSLYGEVTVDRVVLAVLASASARGLDLRKPEKGRG